MKSFITSGLVFLNDPGAKYTMLYIFAVVAFDLIYNINCTYVYTTCHLTIPKDCTLGAP